MPTVLDKILGRQNTGQAATTINCGEVHTLWESLARRYELHELFDIFENFVNDIDFKAIIKVLLASIASQTTRLEQEIVKLGIVPPPRPPKSINTPGNTEVLRDQFMYTIIFSGIKATIEEEIRGLRMMQNQSLVDMYFEMQQQDYDHYSKLIDYGMLKGWLYIPPEYRIAGG